MGFLHPFLLLLLLYLGLCDVDIEDEENGKEINFDFETLWMVLGFGRVFFSSSSSNFSIKK